MMDKIAFSYRQFFFSIFVSNNYLIGLSSYSPPQKALGSCLSFSLFSTFVSSATEHL